jgi:hypothetical protein
MATPTLADSPKTKCKEEAHTHRNMDKSMQGFGKIVNLNIEIFIYVKRSVLSRSQNNHTILFGKG